MKEKNKQRCGTCTYHQHESVDSGWVCINADSEYYTDYTDYGHTCPDWEARR